MCLVFRNHGNIYRYVEITLPSDNNTDILPFQSKVNSDMIKAYQRMRKGPMRAAPLEILKQSGIVLDQVPIQSLAHVPSRHLSKWLKGTWSSNFSDFSEGHPAECLPCRCPWHMAHFFWQKMDFGTRHFDKCREWHSVEWSPGLLRDRMEKSMYMYVHNNNNKN